MNLTAKAIRAFLIAGILVGFTWNPTVAGNALVCEDPQTCEGGYGGLFCNDPEAVMEYCEEGDQCFVSCGGPWVEVDCGHDCHEAD